MTAILSSGDDLSSVVLDQDFQSNGAFIGLYKNLETVVRNKVFNVRIARQLPCSIHTGYGILVSELWATFLYLIEPHWIL